MRIFTGRPRNRFGYAIEDWVQVSQGPTGRHFEKRLPDCVYQEIKRIWGISIGGWFFGLQRVALHPEPATTDGAEPASPKVRDMQARSAAPHSAPISTGNEGHDQ